MNNVAQRLRIVHGDITKLEVDAIVNAANSTLLGGGGVDGAIHRAAGPKLLAKCATLGGCRTGQAKITPAYKLPARHVIHTVGPVWKGGTKGEANLLASCYRECLKLADAEGLRTVAFPCISTGVYRFPAEQACEIAVETVKDLLASTGLETVHFVCFGDGDVGLYQRKFLSLDPSGDDDELILPAE